MKKILTAILAFVIASLVSTVTGLPSYAAEPPNIDKLLDINNTDLRYQNNLEYMNMQVTDPQKLELLLRPSKGVESDNEDIIALAKSLTASLTDDYSKAQAIHNWVCTNIYYDYDELNNDSDTDFHKAALTYQSAATTLSTKRGMCDGYTNLTCALLRASGIASQKYCGMAFDGNSGGQHAWSGAYISNQKRWIVLDTTWDSYNKYHSGNYVAGSTRQKYFAPDLYTFSKDHLYTPLYKPYNSNINFSFNGLKKISMGLDEKVQYNAGYPRPEEGTPEAEERINHIWAGVDDESYVSSDPKVATVDQRGVVTAHAYGTTTISAALLDGSGLITSYVLTVEPQKLSTIYVPSSEMTLGDSFIAEAKTYKYTIKNEHTKWSSSDSKVATVDNDGKITAVGCGTADITATYTDDGLASLATTKIYVNPIRTSIVLSPKTLTVPLNSPTLADITVNDAFGNKLYGHSIEMTSSNPEVATVSGGYVKALREGTTVITASTTLYKTVNGKRVEVGPASDTCIVTVVDTKVVTPRGASPITRASQLDNATAKVKQAVNNRTFYNYMMAYIDILNLPVDQQGNLLNQLNPVFNDANTPKVQKAMTMLETVAKGKDGKIYADTEAYLTGISSDEMDEFTKGYLLGELTSWGRQFVFTSDYVKAVDSLNVACINKDPKSISEAETLIGQVVNSASKSYLQGELNNLKTAVK
jgi:uncharacterized protein YjdB